MAKLIVIEGPDKLGKQTQSELLEKALERLGYGVGMIEVPYRDGLIYKRIYEMLDNGDAAKYPEIFQAFQCANRMAWQNQYADLMSIHDVLILDRWSVSGWVYGRSSGLSDDSLKCMHEGLISPDLVFVFQGKAFKTADRGDDCYESDNEFQKTIRKNYSRWLEENPDIGIAIDANRSKEAILEELVEHCKGIL